MVYILLLISQIVSLSPQNQTEKIEELFVNQERYQYLYLNGEQLQSKSDSNLSETNSLNSYDKISIDNSSDYHSDTTSNKKQLESKSTSSLSETNSLNSYNKISIDNSSDYHSDTTSNKKQLESKSTSSLSETSTLNSYDKMSIDNSSDYHSDTTSNKKQKIKKSMISAPFNRSLSEQTFAERHSLTSFKKVPSKTFNRFKKKVSIKDLPPPSPLKEREIQYQFTEKDTKEQSYAISEILKKQIKKELPPLSKQAVAEQYDERRKNIDKAVKEKLKSETFKYQKIFENWYYKRNQRTKKKVSTKKKYLSIDKRKQLVQEMAQEFNQLEQEINDLVLESPATKNINFLYFLIKLTKNKGDEYRIINEELQKKSKNIHQSLINLTQTLSKKYKSVPSINHQKSLNDEQDYIKNIITKEFGTTFTEIQYFLTQIKSTKIDTVLLKEGTNIINKIKKDSHFKKTFQVEKKILETIEGKDQWSEQEIYDIFKSLKEEPLIKETLKLQEVTLNQEDLTPPSSLLETYNSQINLLKKSIQNDSDNRNILFKILHYDKKNFLSFLKLFQNSSQHLIQLFKEVNIKNKQTKDLKKALSFLKGELEAHFNEGTLYRRFEENYKIKKKHDEILEFIQKDFEEIYSTNDLPFINNTPSALLLKKSPSSKQFIQNIQISA